MKKFILIMAIVLITTLGHTQQYDVTDETRATVNKHRIADILIHNITKQAIVTIQKGYLDSGDFISVSEVTVIFQNQVDDLSTTIDESTTEFTDFISSAFDVKPTNLKNLVKAKLGI